MTIATRVAERQLPRLARERAAVSGRWLAIRALEEVLQLSGPLRRLPDFLIVGTQRGGTSSLYRYLRQHPLIRRPLHKEIGYFSRHYGREESWYRGHFPLRWPRSERTLTFEASPSYLFHPHAPRRAVEAVPAARVVVLLRDPVQRAFSHYRMNVARRVEPLAFGAALAAERSRVDGGLARLAADPDYDSDALWLYSYRSRGRYLPQLRRWVDAFGRSAVFVLASEDLFADPRRETNRVCAFLGLPELSQLDTTAVSFPKGERAPDLRLAPDVAAELAKGFRPENGALFDYLGRDFPWQ